MYVPTDGLPYGSLDVSTSGLFTKFMFNPLCGQETANVVWSRNQTLAFKTAEKSGTVCSFWAQN